MAGICPNNRIGDSDYVFLSILHNILILLMEIEESKSSGVHKIIIEKIDIQKSSQGTNTDPNN